MWRRRNSLKSIAAPKPALASPSCENYSVQPYHWSIDKAFKHNIASKKAQLQKALAREIAAKRRSLASASGYCGQERFGNLRCSADGMNSMLRPERHGRPGNDPLAREQLEAESLRERGEDQHRLEHRERIADANPRPAAERKIREFGNPLRQPVGPPLRPKFKRIVEE